MGIYFSKRWMTALLKGEKAVPGKETHVLEDVKTVAKKEVEARKAPEADPDPDTGKAAPVPNDFDRPAFAAGG